MAFKLVNASDLRVGGYCMVNGDACVIKNLDHSKTGKHGHAKVRMEAVGIFTGKKKVLVIPAKEK